MFRKMYQGGSSRKQGPRPAIRDVDEEPPREAQVRPCEWISEDFMVQADIKDEFDAYVRNADLEDFITREEANEYERRTEAARLQAAALQAVATASQYDPSYNFGYPPGQPWP